MSDRQLSVTAARRHFFDVYFMLRARYNIQYLSVFSSGTCMAVELVMGIRTLLERYAARLFATRVAYNCKFSSRCALAHRTANGHHCALTNYPVRMLTAAREVVLHELVEGFFLHMQFMLVFQSAGHYALFEASPFGIPRWAFSRLLVGSSMRA